MECTRIYSIHDHAITFEFAEIISEVVNMHVIALKTYTDAHPFEGFIESVPAFSSLTVYFNHHTTKDEVIQTINTYNHQLSTVNRLQNHPRLLRTGRRPGIGCSCIET